MSKYSSYKNHQLLTENWRRYLAEATDPDPDEVVARQKVPVAKDAERLMKSPQAQEEIETALADPKMVKLLDQLLSTTKGLQEAGGEPEPLDWSNMTTTEKDVIGAATVAGALPMAVQVVLAEIIAAAMRTGGSMSGIDRAQHIPLPPPETMSEIMQLVIKHASLLSLPIVTGSAAGLAAVLGVYLARKIRGNKKQ